MDNSLISTIIFALHVEQPPSSLCPKHPPPTNLQEKQILYVRLCVCLCVTKIWITTCLHFACQWPAQARENTFLYFINEPLGPGDTVQCTASPGPSGIDHSPAGHLLLDGGEPLSWRFLCIFSLLLPPSPDTGHLHWFHGLSAWRAQKTKSRGPKGLQLKVDAQRAPGPPVHDLYLPITYWTTLKEWKDSNL